MDFAIFPRKPVNDSGNITGGLLCRTRRNRLHKCFTFGGNPFSGCKGHASTPDFKLSCHPPLACANQIC
jgi:hypothetical protein